MMSTAARVRAIVLNFARNVVFTTGELLACGTRNAVDIELCRLVKSGAIKRLAAGVFANLSSVSEPPGIVEVARAKAQRFGKRIMCDTLSSETVNEFLTDGCTSSFASMHGRIYFWHHAPKSFHNSALVAPSPGVRSLAQEPNGIAAITMYEYVGNWAIRKFILHVQSLLESLVRKVQK